jgi:cobalt-zinc-cadmium resistance protein CzcA
VTDSRRATIPGRGRSEACATAAAIGFISLFGVSAMDGILLVSYIRRDINAGIGSDTAIIRAAETRMRQILMTGLSVCIVPKVAETGAGRTWAEEHR